MILGPMIEWPVVAAEGKKPDTRMVRCVIKGYRECPAKCIDACLCGQMPYADYERALQAIERAEAPQPRPRGSAHDHPGE